MIRNLFIATTFVLSGLSFSMGAARPDLDENQFEVSGTGRATGPRGGLACRQAERQAEANLSNNCSVLGRGARLVEQGDVHCSCSSWNDRHFEDCVASVYGICELN